jgi:hypothetical protein
MAQCRACAPARHLHEGLALARITHARRRRGAPARWNQRLAAITTRGGKRSRARLRERLVTCALRARARHVLGRAWKAHGQKTLHPRKPACSLQRSRFGRAASMNANQWSSLFGYVKALHLSRRFHVTRESTFR